MRQTLTEMVMTLQCIPEETIAQTLGCSLISVLRCVDRWNRQGMGVQAATDHRGGSESSFTEEMLQDIDDRSTSPTTPYIHRGKA